MWTAETERLVAAADMRVVVVMTHQSSTSMLWETDLKSTRTGPAWTWEWICPVAPGPQTTLKCMTERKSAQIASRIASSTASGMANPQSQPTSPSLRPPHPEPPRSTAKPKPSPPFTLSTRAPCSTRTGPAS